MISPSHNSGDGAASAASSSGDYYICFVSDCGHSWIALASSLYECPACGRGDGDHHLVAMLDADWWSR